MKDHEPKGRSEPSSQPPPPRFKHRFSLLYQGIVRPHLRTRLVLAFFALIISSALATILIGNFIFGRKVDQLARDKVGLYIKVANQVFNLRMEKIRLTAMRLATQLEAGERSTSIYQDIHEELPVDFILCCQDGRFESFTKRYEPGTTAPTLQRLSGAYARDANPVNVLITRTGFTRESATGLAVLQGTQLEPFGMAGRTGEVMVMLGAAPTAGGAVIIGSILNNRREMMDEIKQAIAPTAEKLADVTLFLGDTRIASTIGPSSVGSHAEPKIAQKVIGQGQPYTGRARVIDLFFFTSYMPLVDLDGRVIGMLGAGTNEEVYSQVKRQTTTLFSSLIVAGMIFGINISYLFSVWLMRPIASLAKGMSRVAEGDLNYKVRLNSMDELGKLADAFNKMVKAVKERDHRLHEMTENRLSAIEKQISIGRLAAGVAHEINNPLTAILSLSTLMLKHTPADDSRHEDLDIIVTETTRCREIVRNLLDFARESPVDKIVVDINQVLRDTLSLAGKYEAMERANVEVNLSPEPLYVDADPKMIQQVFTNVLLNAAEALEKNGTIRVVTDEDSSGSFAQVQVQDTGKGIPQEHLDRIFQPFFTTKGRRKGTGLGLSVSLGIIQKHEGTIEIHSDEGKGTVVTIMLPRVIRDLQQPAVAVPRRTPVPGAG